MGCSGAVKSGLAGASLAAASLLLLLLLTGSVSRVDPLSNGRCHPSLPKRTHTRARGPLERRGNPEQSPERRGRRRRRRRALSNVVGRVKI